MLTTITVREVLNRKGRGFWAVSRDSNAYEALELMAEKDIGALIVLHDKRIVGIFSERDYARKVILQGRASRTTPVGDLMSSPAVTVGPEFTLRNCMDLMKVRRIRHLPVLEHGTLVGMITMRDVVDAIIETQASEIEELENYIAGNQYPSTTAA